MKNITKLILIVGGALLAVSALALSIHIWQSSPFFNMTLVFLDAVLVLLAAALLATAMLCSSG